ncbi:arabinan endo-1,5-alpha-L-arabinosidase [Pontibacter qinzhouensis]|uniref:Arabinan endo-1,5-alpha-L-arabinosidase n=1 Tax=Pontibacter qinzhouensis TaxID=2603253 RepID=A0A5C8JA89_9BACT|nr:family 43 glycosylhydrolase [Pontibacter qinzhouensis]TXK33893.1 arabinan endo-1,5-alpha-L-arabinosidase [Pontibacter qinzhouensis]
MKLKLKSLLLIFLLAGTCLQVQAQGGRQQVGETRQDIVTHDPVMAKHGDRFYLFSTGHGISIWSSSDLKNWRMEKPVFETAPQWAVDTIPGFKNHIWAPDISYYKGQYYLYYSVSAFGKNTSAIGLATNPTLNPEDPNYKWTDHGRVIQSYPGKTNWNAIDPHIIADKKGTAYMSFGSFWDGLKLVKLSKDRKSIAENPDNLLTIASRKKDPSAPNPPSIDNNPVDAGGNAIEAPFIFQKGKYYYLFASIDYCCKGVNSSYKMIVGRSKKIPGPYVDKEGIPLNKAGGTLVLEGDESWHGVGHNSVYNFDGTDYLVFHGYDASANGAPKLRIEKLSWTKDGWPVLETRE